MDGTESWDYNGNTQIARVTKACINLGVPDCIYQFKHLKTPSCIKDVIIDGTESLDNKRNTQIAESPRPIPNWIYQFKDLKTRNV